MSKYTKEIEKRRTFAIISHPDAGKTTLTEKFLLYGGAINLAGSVKGKATALAYSPIFNIIFLKNLRAYCKMQYTLNTHSVPFLFLNNK